VTVDNTVEDASEVTDDIPNHPPAEPVWKCFYSCIISK
jgi:hypothetical protein